jgi:hypothetical protein
MLTGSVMRTSRRSQTGILHDVAAAEQDSRQALDELAEPVDHRLISTNCSTRWTRRWRGRHGAFVGDEELLVRRHFLNDVCREHLTLVDRDFLLPVFCRAV